MSGSAGEDLDPDEIANKIERYSYLLPAASPELISKMQSSQPEQAIADPGAEAGTSAMTGGAIPLPVWPELTHAHTRDRVAGCLLGLAVGDAVGAAAVSKPRDSFPALTDMTGGGSFNLKAGEWTGGTTMALCLGESLLEAESVDQDDFMERLRGWLERGENTVSSRCFDIGATTRAAIENFIATGIAASGRLDARSAGSGSLVRLAPAAIFAAGDYDTAEILALKQSRATHAHPECLDACKLFVSQLMDALSGADKDAATRQRVMNLSPKLLFISASEWRGKTRDQINSDGYVVNTLEAALWSVWQTDNFRDAVLTAANLGGHANRVAAVAGQLAGALYGAAAIPHDWLAKLAWGAKIGKLAVELSDHGSA